MEDKNLTISKVEFSGKWVDFFFKEEKRYSDILDDDFNPTGEKEETWLHSCKTYILWGAVEKSEMLHEVYNNGLVGKKTKWIYNDPNWILEEISL